MKVIDYMSMCSQGRICVTDFFGGKKPNFVRVSVDTDLGCIRLEKAADDETELSYLGTVDVKGRIFVPSWVRKLLPQDTKGFYVALIGCEKVLVPATKNVNWAKVAQNDFPTEIIYPNKKESI